MREKLFTLSRSQRDELERRYKQTNERRIAERIQAILLLDAGHNRDQTARILHVNPKTITRWVKLFVRVDLDTYCTLQSGGNEAALSTSQQQQLASWLDQQVRSTKEAIVWVEETFDVSYTESGMLKLLRRMDYRYKKPAQVPAKADSEAQAEWLESYTEKRGP